MNYAAQTSDPATFEIIKNSLYKIAEEMRVVLAKTAYSPLLKSAGDYSCGLFDARGEMVAQGPDLPIHLGSMPDAVRAVVSSFAADVHEGDVFLHNDPYFGGSHLPDMNVVRPAFHEGQLLGYACLRAHWPDVGSATPGSYGAVTDIFGEGLRLPPVRLISRDALDADLEKVILANVRTPEERKGDLGAQLAATLRATERLRALARRYGSAELIGYMAQVMDYSERLMRAILVDLPDGGGAFEDFCDGDGIADDELGNDAPFRIRLSVKKIADRLIVDFAGTDPQVKGPMNAPLSVTASGVYCGLKTAELRLLARHRDQGARGLRRERHVSRAGRLCQSRDVPSSGRHGDGRTRRLPAGAGDGLQPGHLGDPDAGRRRPSQRAALCFLRNRQGGIWGTTEQGWHQLHRQRHFQYYEYAGGDHGNVVSGAYRAL
jgi:hypothetical protein